MSHMMNRRLNLAVVIIILFFALLIIPMVMAEEKFVPVWIQAEVSKTNATFTFPSILEPRKIIIITPAISGNDTSIIARQNVSFITKADLVCTQTQLENLTKSLINACTLTGEHVRTCTQIFQTNTELSGKISELNTKVDGAATCQQNLNGCQSSLQTATNSNSQTNTQNYLWGGAIGAALVLGGQYLIRKKAGREGPGMNRGNMPGTRYG